MLNDHLAEHKIKYSSKISGHSPDTVIVMGEKRSDQPDYYMNGAGDGGTPPFGDFDRVVELYRHGVKLGSNYLFMDGHVGTLDKRDAMGSIDPWDLNGNQPIP